MKGEACELMKPGHRKLQQLVGIIAYGVFTVVASLIVWFILKAVVGIRVDEEGETIGLDKAEIGVEAYPEFGLGRA